MIKNVNNIAFKGVYLDKSIKNMKPENLEKLKMPVEMSEELHPDMDVFLSSDRRGELVMRVQDGEPLIELMDEEVGDAMKLKPAELFSLLSLMMDLKNTYNLVWNKEEPFAVDSTKNIDNMDSFDIATQLNSLIKNFKKVHPKKLN